MTRITRIGGAVAAASTLLAALLVSSPVAAKPARPAPPQVTVAVAGALATPATYTMSALEALPQSTFAAPPGLGWRPGGDQGVSLENLVESSNPELPLQAKNASLRVIVTVRGATGVERTFALGELDPSFGNHPAYLALEESGRTLTAPDLVVPGDSSGVRGVPDVKEIDVAVESPSASAPPAVGDLVVQDGSRSVVLTARELAALPAKSLSVSFYAGSTSETYTEHGPTLDTVLQAAHIHSDLTTWVAGVGSDGYVATVTPGEAWVGGRPLLISLAEDGQSFLSQGEGPRLIADGDVKGGRDDSGLDDLVVGDTQASR